MERCLLRSNALCQLKGRWAVTIGTILVLQIINLIILFLAYKISTILGVVTSLMFVGLVSAGMCSYTLNIARNNNAKFADIFDGFNSNVMEKAIGLGVIITLITSLANIVVMLPIIKKFFEHSFTVINDFSSLIVPTIILSILNMIIVYIIKTMFSQVFYILIDNPELSLMDCFKNNLKMIKGHKLECFCLQLSFLGWWIAIVAIGFVLNATQRYIEANVPGLLGGLLLIIGFILIVILYLILTAYIEVTFANYYMELKAIKENNF